jgi:hypothetical protein
MDDKKDPTGVSVSVSVCRFTDKSRCLIRGRRSMTWVSSFIYLFINFIQRKSFPYLAYVHIISKGQCGAFSGFYRYLLFPSF